MLTTLHIHHVRNLIDNRLTLSKHNLFIGDNGSGKTSLLEAIFLLSRGRSFRHHQPKHYIHHHHDHCIIWAKRQLSDSEQTFALKKNTDASTQLRYNNLPQANQSTLTKQLPTLIIDPLAITLLEHGTQDRRQLLDWLSFHLYDDFYSTWLSHNRLLKQRNALLRHAQKNQATFVAWDNALEQYANQLHQYRQNAFELWQTAFTQTVTTLLPRYECIHLSYQAGFDTQKSLSAILQTRLPLDIELGYTRIGAHRADIAIHLTYHTAFGTKKEQAVHILSRGEKKLLIIALKLAQLAVICQQSDKPPLVLIDDIGAELDKKALAILFKTLFALPCQLFITSLDDDILTIISEQDLILPSVFYLQDGIISPAT